MDEETKSLIRSIYLQNKEIKEDILIIKNDLQKVSTNIQELEEKVKFLETQNNDLNAEIEIVKRNKKKNNLVIFGIEEVEESETWSVVKATLESKLSIKLEEDDINNSLRIGKQNTNGKRPIILELVRNLKKQEILKNCRKLKGTEISISHDLTPKERDEKKVLYKHYKEAKENKCEATLFRNKLVINGVPYKYEDFVKENIDLDHIETLGNSSDSSSKRKNALSPQEGRPKRFTRSVSKETKKVD
ncbi:unnamed protein product [Phaedon cochleariae]|uniref:Endonuclease-reverse transcriptase n=1 Tax=Phaedon cochleariae TaxID=80249 RepID=A0A9N9X3K8_PHACE|nr:unnamed protein product [Phaedon cochleariae]